jgi:hypothetical protein
MDDSEAPDSSTGLEDVLNQWDDRLAQLEREAAATLRAAKRLRRAAQEGAVARFPDTVADLQDCAAKLHVSVHHAARPPPIDLAEAFADGSFLAELARAAAAANVTLVQRDGRVSAYPVVLRLEPRAQGVRIGRKLERRIRPSFLARHLRALQQRPGRFNPRAFLDRVFRGYAVVAPGRAADWQPNRRGEGPLVPLADLHDVLTLLPAAAADYPLEEFLVDLLQLNRQPDTRTGRGHRFDFGGSTGVKGAKRLSAFDETGARHDFYAVRFTLE